MNRSSLKPLTYREIVKILLDHYRQVRKVEKIDIDLPIIFSFDLILVKRRVLSFLNPNEENLEKILSKLEHLLECKTYFKRTKLWLVRQLHSCCDEVISLKASIEYLLETASRRKESLPYQERGCYLSILQRIEFSRIPLLLERLAVFEKRSKTPSS